MSGILTLIHSPSGGTVKAKPRTDGAVASHARRIPALTLALALSAGLWASAAPGADSYYRWRDEQGNLVISDRPPAASIDYEVVSSGSNRLRRVSPGDGPATGSDGATAGQEKASEDEPGNETIAVEVLPERDPELCERARQNLETLNSAARIRVKDANGELRYLSDEERESQRKNALDTIEVHCEE
jgi:hypothetical protein